MGEDQRLITQGYGEKILIDGFIQLKTKFKEFYLTIEVPVLFEGFYKKNIYAPLGKQKEDSLILYSGILKKKKETIEIFSPIDFSKIMEIIDEI